MLISQLPGLYNVTLKISNDYDSDELIMRERIIVLPTEGMVAYYPFNENAYESNRSQNLANRTSLLFFVGSGTCKTAIAMAYFFSSNTQAFVR